MRTKIAAAALATGLVAGGGAALLAPGLALADTATPTATASPSVTDRAASRLSALASALKGLVTDGTLTQAQADKVARTLSTADLGGGPGHGPRAGHVSPEATASVLGITVDQLHTARESGKTLAQIAATKGISKADLVSKLVAAAKTQLATDVKAGRLTQAQADTISAGLTARVTEEVDEVHTGGHGDHGAPPAGGSTTTPSASPSASTS
jgi:hypothetical protein